MPRKPRRTSGREGLEGRSHIFSAEKIDEPGSRKFVSDGEQIIRDLVLSSAQIESAMFVPRKPRRTSGCEDSKTFDSFMESLSSFEL